MFFFSELPTCFDGPVDPCRCVAVHLPVNKTVRLLIRAEQRYTTQLKWSTLSAVTREYHVIRIREISGTSCDLEPGIRSTL